MARISMRSVQQSTFEQIFSLYLSAAAKGVKDKTLNTYKQHFRAMRRFPKRKSVKSTKPDDRSGELNHVARKPENSKAHRKNKTRNWKRDYHEPVPGLFFSQSRKKISISSVVERISFSFTPNALASNTE